MNIETMMACNEEFKQKGLLLSKEDLFEWLCLRDDMITEANKIKQEVTIWKLELDKDKAKRVLELKSVVDEKWKWLTEKAIEGNIRIEFQERELELITKKTVGELLRERAESILEFVNIVKIELKSKIEL